MASNKPESNSQTEKRSSAPRGSETILVVEDDPFVRKVAVRILERHGYKVFQANSGDSAIALVEKEELEFDLMVTDIFMPYMDGYELADTLKQKLQRAMKILFTSGYGPDSMALNGVLEEGAEFISKPYTPKELARKVRTMLDG
ncbi:MAG: response regulator [Proteobacteria bacterium]|nr:response regulator [Pseudomonadota bacterium]